MILAQKKMMTCLYTGESNYRSGGPPGNCSWLDCLWEEIELIKGPPKFFVASNNAEEIWWYLYPNYIMTFFCPYNLFFLHLRVPSEVVGLRLNNMYSFVVRFFFYPPFGSTHYESEI